MKSQQLKNLILSTGDKLFSYKAQLFMMMAVISGVVLVLSLFELFVIVIFFIFAGSIIGFVNTKWDRMRKKGIINLMSPQAKKTLLERSIMDIYRDLIYFPKVTRIISAFIRGALSKPHPEQIEEFFEDLQPEFKNLINTKGILHLAPSNVEKLILQKKQPDFFNTDINLLSGSQDQILERKNNLNDKFLNNILMPSFYGSVNKKWDKLQKYEKSQDQVHEITLHSSILDNARGKIKWRHIILLCGLIGYGLMKTNKKKMGKIFLYNGSAAGIVIVSIMVLLKYSKPSHKKKISKLIQEELEQKQSL